MNAYRRTWMALALLSLAPTAALAQSWEMASGLPTQRDVHRGTKEVRNCLNPGGVLSVGTTTPGGVNPNTNMLIERLTAGAGTLFRFQYDTAQRPEQAAQVVEFRDGTGFAVVGSLDPTSTTAPQSRFIVTKIDCNGQPLWRFSYGDTTEVNTGWDILQANSGTAAAGTSAGDLVALGRYFSPATATAPAIHRARIARTRVNGAPIWVRDYQTSISGDFELHAIAELVPVLPNATGDLVAVGRIGGEAAVLQVNGNTGAVVCTARMRGLGTAQYHDVVPVRTAAGTPEFLAVGETTAAGAASQVYLSRFVPNCLLRVHTHWGATADREIGWAGDLTLATTYGGVGAGALLFGGEVNGAYNGVFSQDAFLHVAHPQTLMPLIPIGRRYGTQGALAEKALTLSAASNGAYFAGLTTTDWLANGDPQHAFTARASVNGLKTNCAVDWQPLAFDLTPASQTYGVTTITRSALQEPLPARQAVQSQTLCCGVGP
ncbi:MAG: hypothetical protein KF800_02305 [Lysobacter sp.]|nr:hypothetical protein [Lysobacter sp.]